MAAVEHQRFADQPDRELGGIEGEFAAAQAAQTRTRNSRVRVTGDGRAMRKRKRFRSLHLGGINFRCRGTLPGYAERQVKGQYHLHG